MRLALIALLCLPATACLAKPGEPPNAAHSAKPANPTKSKDPKTMNPPDSAFAKAQSAFRKEVAQSTGTVAEHVHVTPETEDLIGYRELATGDLIAFQADLPIEPPPAAGPKRWNVRGFASAAGVVVLAQKNNLDVLLRAAHLLDPASSLPARAIAERLLWLFTGPPGSPKKQLLESGGMIFQPPPVGPVAIGPPAIERRPDGSARLVLFYASIGQGGAATNLRAELVCGKDYAVAPFAL